MKAYDVYVPFEPGNGTTQGWSWLEKLLKEQFGEFSKAVGIHEGSWGSAGVSFQGRVNTYSVCADEKQARPFFQSLKRQVSEREHSEILIVEKAAPGPGGELAGERI